MKVMAEDLEDAKIVIKALNDLCYLRGYEKNSEKAKHAFAQILERKKKCQKKQ